MPQSVNAYLDSKNFEASDVAKRRILNYIEMMLVNF